MSFDVAKTTVETQKGFKIPKELAKTHPNLSEHKDERTVSAYLSQLNNPEYKLRCMCLRCSH